MTKLKDSHKCNILLQYTIFIGIINMVFLIKPVGKILFPYPEKMPDRVSERGEETYGNRKPKRRKIMPSRSAGKCKIFSVPPFFPCGTMAKRDQIC